ncbi:MAG: glycoside hydrolase family 130 protein, partial [Candidatus Anammoxibacter sp.]
MSNLDSGIKELGNGEVITIGSGDVIFKLDSYPGNPIITPQDMGLTWHEDNVLKYGAVFNGGAELVNGQIMLLPRCHGNYKKVKFFDERLGIERNCLENYCSEVWPLVSNDGIHFTRFKDVVIRGDGSDHKDFSYGIEDIRVFKWGQKHILIGCGKVKRPFKDTNADRIAIYTTDDFTNITFHGIIDSFDSRNAVLFPEPINGRDYMLLRFYPNINISSLDAGIEQLLDPAKHKKQWQEIYERKDQTILLKAGLYPHEKEKLGPGPQLISTEKGLLLIYHAVGEIGSNICETYGLSKKIERGYSVCVALLDSKNPKKI